MFRHIKTAEYKAELSNVGSAVQFVEEHIGSRYDSKERIRFLLSFEELLVQLCYNAPNADTVIHIQLSQGKEDTHISLSCIGDRLSLNEIHSLTALTDEMDIDDEAGRIISGMILKNFSDRAKLKYSNGINRITLSIRQKKKVNYTVLAILFGILAGILLRFLLPEVIRDFFLNNVVTLISDMFMRAIKMILVPLVFFSIADSVSGFSDYQTFGRIGAKIIGFYMCTTIAAIAIGVTVFFVFKPGSPDILPMVMEMIGSAEKVAPADVSIRNMLVEIIPYNLTATFFNGDMMQTIFVGIVVGIAGGLLGESSEKVHTFIQTGNELFCKIMTLIAKTLPLAVFSIMTNLAATTDTDSVLTLSKIFGTVLIGLVCIAIVYSLLLIVLGKINPLKFFGEYSNAILMAFSTCSSSATMPISMSCLDKMGVSPKVYSFSVPLGATINMDGGCIQNIMLTLCMTQIFGIHLSMGSLLALCITVMLLSIATPGAPGAAIAGVATLLGQVGVPTEAIVFLLPVLTLLDFFTTTSNVVGDAVVTTIVAKSEGLLEQKKH